MDSSKPPVDPQPARRRSSGLYESLMAQKRGSEAQARRASHNDQRYQAGFFATMWQK
ncbi:hypothetical protein GGR56DRAFT_671029 [Xylariaceae sp. FL0804]|nr:hypothetical protein GGR56DRAFT_671029 [Xylariaceae sp. FL0804]